MKSMRIVLAGAVCASLASASVAGAACDGKEDAGRYNGLHVWKQGGAVGFTSPELRVDADGAPNSYRVDGKGLSYTCDGVVAVVDGVRYTPSSHPQTWQKRCNDGWRKARESGDYSRLDIFGFATDANGKPIVQGPGDPLPGQAFITTTSVIVPGQPDGTQRRYVDATQIPYVVLPGGFVSTFSVGQAAVVAVRLRRGGSTTFAIYGDGGRLGEGSVRLHQDLGRDPIVVRGGTPRAKRNIEEAVDVLVFPAVAVPGRIDSEAWRKAIDEAGNRALAAWGGDARLEDCF